MLLLQLSAQLAHFRLQLLNALQQRQERARIEHALHLRDPLLEILRALGACGGGQRQQRRRTQTKKVSRHDFTLTI